MLNNEKVAALFDKIHDEFYQLKISEIDEIRDEIIALVRADEREACARVCDDLRDEDGYEAWNTECAAAIRARKEKE